MAYERILHAHQRPVKAATTLIPNIPLVLGGSSALLAIPAGSNNSDIFGWNGAATVASGAFCTVLEDQNVVKAVACASLGAGAVVDIGSTTGRLRPAAGASGAPRYEVGVSETPAADGETFSVRIRPRRNGVWS